MISSGKIEITLINKTMNKELLQDLNAVYNGLNEDLDESKILLGNIIDKLETAINYTRCCKSDSEQLCEVCNNDQVFETEDGFIADCPRCN